MWSCRVARAEEGVGRWGGANQAPSFVVQERRRGRSMDGGCWLGLFLGMGDDGGRELTFNKIPSAEGDGRTFRDVIAVIAGIEVRSSDAWLCVFGVGDCEFIDCFHGRVLETEQGFLGVGGRVFRNAV